MLFLNATKVAKGRGFTLVELVMVIILIGILSLLGIGLFVGKSAFSPLLASQQLASATRLAQQAALAGADHGSLTVRQSASQFEFVVGEGTAAAQTFSLAREGANLSASTGLPVTIAFDTLGRPASRQNMTFTFSSDSSFQICLSSLGAVYEGACL